MKISKLIKVSFLFLFLCGCSILSKSDKMNNQNRFKEITLPFEEEDYVSNNFQFFQISNTFSTSLNIAKQKNLNAAKALLSQKVNSYITTLANQSLYFKSNIERESFISRTNSITVLLLDNVKLEESKIFKKSDGKYDYWAVYSLTFNDISDLNENLNIVSSEQYNELLKSVINEKTELKASEETKKNTYFIDDQSNSKPNLRNIIEMESKSYLGIPYVWGGSTPEIGFDCSGFVRWVYKKSTGKLIVRTTKEHYNKYKNHLSNEINNFEKGDLIYFKTLPDRIISHVGIYLGNRKFIHAPNGGESIKIDSISNFWEKNLVGLVSVNNI